jgi:formate dehydrogenase major subunit/NADH-quinone oxidoreductase subunit G
MVIFTNCAEVERLRRRSFELLMSEHDINCRLCGKKHDCELLRISKHFNYRLKSVELTNLKKRFPVDRSHKYIIIDPNRCVLCGRCVWVCSTIRKKGILGFINRGKYARISTFSNIPLAETECDGCMMCVEICPAGGIVKK